MKNDTWRTRAYYAIMLLFVVIALQASYGYQARAGQWQTNVLIVRIIRGRKGLID